MLAVEAEGVPVELTNLDRWCLWRLTTRDGKSTKQPFQTSGEPAKSNDPATWDTFDSVVAEYARRPGHWSGIGFVFSTDDPFCGIDLDGCRNATTGELAPWAKRIVDHFATYSEVSPSVRPKRNSSHAARRAAPLPSCPLIDGGTFARYADARLTRTSRPCPCGELDVPVVTADVAFFGRSDAAKNCS